MNTIVNLYKLQQIKLGECTGKEISEAELRARVPAQVLIKFDRFLARKKKAVALVRDNVCGGCHMQLPIGMMNTLLQSNGLVLCESCGRYLFLPPRAKIDAANQGSVKPQTATPGIHIQSKLQTPGCK